MNLEDIPHHYARECSLCGEKMRRVYKEEDIKKLLSQENSEEGK